MAAPRTNWQTLHGKLCVALYEQHGPAMLPTFEQIYGAYGRELGRGLRRKHRPQTLAQAAEAFAAMTAAAGLPSRCWVQGGEMRFEGGKCPFGLENTHRAVCEALMAMDRELFRELLGVPPGGLEMTIEASLAAGDAQCAGLVRLV